MAGREDHDGVWRRRDPTAFVEIGHGDHRDRWQVARGGGGGEKGGVSPESGGRSGTYSGNAPDSRPLSPSQGLNRDT